MKSAAAYNNGRMQYIRNMGLNNGIQAGDEIKARPGQLLFRCSVPLFFLSSDKILPSVLFFDSLNNNLCNYMILIIITLKQALLCYLHISITNVIN